MPAREARETLVTCMTDPVLPPAPMTIDNPVIPLGIEIPNGLQQAKMIFISGTPTSAIRFSVDIQDGQSFNDVGFHVDVRFNHHGFVNTVVRNNKSNGKWGEEEKNATHFPFIPNTPFEMLIECEETGFKVAVNNQHLFQFSHRLKPLDFAKYNLLRIRGDVRITQVRLHF